MRIKSDHMIAVSPGGYLSEPTSDYKDPLTETILSGLFSKEIL